MSCHPPSSTFFSNGSGLDDLEEHDGKVSIGGRTITNLPFSEDIGLLAEALLESVNKTCTIENSTEKTKLI